ncbi:MAG: SulP family inorganic anion transporter [Proteobacteria bacterium]|nr:SulP family inorganic anion transporter [Pseudomonadota bacterium]
MTRWFNNQAKNELISNSISALVVFLVALPLCIGIAAACGLTPDKGIIAGVIGGIVVGLTGGAPLQVSGPANGLIPVVAELVSQHGVAILGAAVMVAGLLQALAGFLRLGVFFRAFCPSVVYGLMAGFGLVIFSSQLMIALNGSPESTFFANMQEFPRQLSEAFISPAVQHAILISTVTLFTILVWNRFNKTRIPAYLVAIVTGTLLHAGLGLLSRTVEIPESIRQDLLEGSNSLSFLLAEDAASISTILEFAVTIAILASIETMVSTASLDKMTKKIPSNYNRELIAQGIGNFICGLFSAPPITGVIIRSAANVTAGATSRLSTIFHGFLLLAAMLAFGSALKYLPSAALAAILMHAALRLINLPAVKQLIAEERRHLWTFSATTLAVVSLGVLYGVAFGLTISAWSLLRKFARLEIKQIDSKIELSGVATFIDIPKLLRVLDRVPSNRQMQLCTSGVMYMDPSAKDIIESWRRRVSGDDNQS